MAHRYTSFTIKNTPSSLRYHKHTWSSNHGVSETWDSISSGIQPSRIIPMANKFLQDPVAATISFHISTSMEFYHESPLFIQFQLLSTRKRDEPSLTGIPFLQDESKQELRLSNQLTINY